MNLVLKVSKYSFALLMISYFVLLLLLDHQYDSLELIGWLGIAIASSHLNVFLVFMSMTSYLLGRSVSQNEFNKKKFVDEWPADRKNLVPFIF